MTRGEEEEEEVSVSSREECFVCVCVCFHGADVMYVCTVVDAGCDSRSFALAVKIVDSTTEEEEGGFSRFR